MVKIVVRTAEEIIRAYLKGMGLTKGDCLSALLAGYPKLQDEKNSGHGVIDMLDDIVAKAAKQLFGASSQTQLIALYKIAYLELNGAKKWGVAPLLPNYHNAEYEAEMRQKLLIQAPKYHFSDMPVQEFVAYKPSLIHKIFGKKDND